MRRLGAWLRAGLVTVLKFAAVGLAVGTFLFFVGHVHADGMVGVVIGVIVTVVTMTWLIVMVRRDGRPSASEVIDQGNREIAEGRVVKHQGEDGSQS